jgi:hypothetical protein
MWPLYFIAPQPGSEQAIHWLLANIRVEHGFDSKTLLCRPGGESFSPLDHMQSISAIKVLGILDARSQFSGTNVFDSYDSEDFRGLSVFRSDVGRVRLKFVPKSVLQAEDVIWLFFGEGRLAEEDWFFSEVCRTGRLPALAGSQITENAFYRIEVNGRSLASDVRLVAKTLDVLGIKF